jgi:phage-related protein
LSEDDESFDLNLSPEELNNLAKAMANAFSDTISSNPEAFLPEVTHVSNIYPVVTVPFDLDLIASSVSGVTDIVGQLKEFINSTLGSIAGSIISSIQTWIDQNIKPVINSVLSGVTSFIRDNILPVVGGKLMSLPDFFTKIIVPNLSSFISTNVLGTMLNIAYQVFQPAISGLKDWLGSAFDGIKSWFLDALKSGWNWIDSLIGGLKSWLGSALQSGWNWVTSTIADVGKAIIGTILPAISQLSSFAQSSLFSIMGGINKLFGLPSVILEGASKLFSGGISSLVNFIQQSILGRLTDLWNTLSTIAGQLSNAVTQLSSYVVTGYNVISTAFMGFANALLNLPTWFDEHISKPLGQAVSGLAEGFWKMLPDFVKEFLVSAKDFFVNMALFVVEFPKDPLGAISKYVLAPASTFISNLPIVKDYIIPLIKEHLFPFLKALAGFVVEFPKNPLKAISDYVLTPVSTFISGLPIIKDYVVPFIQNLKSSFDSLIKDPRGWLEKNILQPVADFINKTPFLRDVVVPSLKNLAGLLIEFPKDPLGSLKKYLLDPVVNFVSGLPIIKDYIVPFVKKAGEEFNKFIKDPIAYTKGVAEAVWNALTGLFSKVLELVGKAVSGLVDVIKTVVTGFWNVATGVFMPIANNLIGFVKSLVGAITQPIHDLILGIASAGTSLGKDFVGSIVNLAGSVAEPMGKLFTEPLQALFTPLNEALGKGLENLVAPQVEKLRKGEVPQGELLQLLVIMGAIPPITISATALMRGYYMVFRYLATLPTRVPFRLTIGYRIGEGNDADIMFAPLSVGQRLAVKMLQSFGVVHPIEVTFDTKALFLALAKEFKYYPTQYARSIVDSTSMWLTQPLSRLSASIFRNFLPMEMPSLETLIEYLKRHMGLGLDSDAFKKVLEDTKGFLRLYGYNDSVIDWTTRTDLTITVTDRFGNPRTVPLALMYTLPSPSDVAEMYVKDIFKSPEDFFKLYLARGMHKDVGSLYYFLRFKYPPPERLWQFVTRGISGMLWASIPEAERNEIMKEAGALGGFKPADAKALNFEHSTLFSSFRTYMKWHDFFRPSWIEGFTSDNQIMLDTLADIPTKIDQRWMVRFGLYQLLKESGVDMKSDASAFTKVVQSGEATTGIVMDLENFCRTLQATGIHPYYVPITAVAETIMSVSDERNLLRTGTLSLFKEGLWSVDALNKMLNGALTVSFNVAYFDPSPDKLDWSVGHIDVPIRFLPPEAKLTQLRALMDRALDIFKEFIRDMANAYQDYIVEKYETTETTPEGKPIPTFKSITMDIINDINSYFAKDYKSIVGQDLPDELKLQFVEDFFKPYAHALEQFRDVYAIRRVRSWTQRWIGWLMYRLATGVTKKEEFSNFVNTVSKASHLTPTEINFLSQVMEMMYTIATREYIPTPSQLATLSEYLVIPSDLITAVYDERNVPDKWRPIWTKYIEIRPTADDVRELISTYMYVIRYVKLPDDIVNKVKGYASYVGYRDKELAIFDLRAQLNEMLLNIRQNVREYIPTPMSLATLVEYVPKAREFFDDVVKAKNIPKEWQELWATYLDIRPIVDDVKRYFSRAEELYAKFMMKEGAFKKVLDDVKNYLGYTDKEIEFLMLTTKYERWRNAWNELIGTVEKMVLVSEYSPVARDYAVGKLYEMIDALPIDNAEKDKLKKMWEQYIRVRPIYDEVKRYVTDLINAVVDGTISEQTFASELDSLKEWGLGDDEIMFYKAMAGLRKARKLKIYLG